VKSYPNYKDSGVPWLGKVPAHWEISKLSRIANETSIKNRRMVERNLLSLSYGRIIRKDIESNEGLLPASFEGYHIVERGDTVLRLTDLQNDQRSLRAGFVNERGIITSAYNSIRPTKVTARWLFNCLRTIDLLKVFYAMGGGVRQSLDYEGIKRLDILVPPESEQLAIDNYIGDQEKQINAAISSQEQLIELLKERRSAIIIQAVTKGLNPDAKMKDSGVPWLGQLPAHWEVKRARFLCKIDTGSADTEDKEDDAKIPFYVRSQNVERISKSTHIGEAVLTAGDGAGVGKVYHHHRSGQFAAHQRVYVMQNFQKVLARYFYYSFSGMFSKVALEGGAKSTVDSLRRPMLTNFFVALPPADEQAKIVSHLDSLVMNIDHAISSQINLIELLKERRSAIITQAVTGQIDVR